MSSVICEIIMGEGDSKPAVITSFPHGTRRRLIKLSEDAIVKMGFPVPGRDLPLEIRPSVDGIDLPRWAGKKRPWLENLLARNGGILFRDFPGVSVEPFREFVKATSNGEMLEYRDRSTPRIEIGDRIYTSTEYPASHSIALHNEGTYWLKWPQKIYFYCQNPPAEGGETVIADVRRVYNRISPQVRERFRKTGVCYWRNFNDGVSLTWRATFQTDEKSEVEEYCRRNDIGFEWKYADRLRTRQVRPAIYKHPLTGEPVWFNHAAFFHVSSLEPEIRDAFLAEFRREELPYNTYYGDGSEIEGDALEEIRRAYEEEKVSFKWQACASLRLDNMLVAHGREPYTGSRRILVGMADPVSRGIEL